MTFSGSGFTPSEVNSIPKCFFDLRKIQFSGFKVRFSFWIASITFKKVSLRWLVVSVDQRRQENMCRKTGLNSDWATFTLIMRRV